MDPASTTLKLLAALALIAVHAVFVAAEQSLTAARRARLEPLARAGDGRAARLLATLDAPGDLRPAAQLGATLTTLGVGLLAFSVLYGVLYPRLDPLEVASGPAAARAAAVTAALVVLAVLHVVLGVMVPRHIALSRPEVAAAWTIPVVRGFAALAWPLLRVMDLLTRLLGATGSAPPHLHSPEELRMLVEQSTDGAAEDEQEQMLLGVIQFNDTLAREVMTPRRDIIALPETATRAETLALVADEGHSRIPVYRESIDDVTGVLLVKDLLTYVIANPDANGDFDLRRLVREPYFVPDTKRIGELLPELRTRSVHMAIVLDEFGGTDGLVTLEDMLEEIVGDIFDEHDVPEEEEDFAITEAGEILIDGSASIFDVNEKFKLSLPEQDYDTIGGFIFGELGRVPVPGDIIALDGAGELMVDEVEERRVTRVRLIPADTGAPPTGDGSAE